MGAVLGLVRRGLLRLVAGDGPNVAGSRPTGPALGRIPRDPRRLLERAFAALCRVAMRLLCPPEIGESDLGFRVVRRAP